MSHSGVIESAVVYAHLDRFHAAAWCYRALATELMGRLCVKLGLPPEVEHWEQRPQSQGRLDDEWDYYFHGAHCCFTNRDNGRNVEASLRFGVEFGVLDPWFFTRFLRVEPGFEDLAGKINEPFHDGVRILDILEQEQRLLQVGTPDYSGWVAHEPQRTLA